MCGGGGVYFCTLVVVIRTYLGGGMCVCVCGGTFVHLLVYMEENRDNSHYICTVYSHCSDTYVQCVVSLPHSQDTSCAVR